MNWKYLVCGLMKFIFGTCDKPSFFFFFFCLNHRNFSISWISFRWTFSYSAIELLECCFEQLSLLTINSGRIIHVKCFWWKTGNQMSNHGQIIINEICRLGNLTTEYKIVRNCIHLQIYIVHQLIIILTVPQSNSITIVCNVGF